jgi:outer membrane protein assembly factor BamB
MIILFTSNQGYCQKKIAVQIEKRNAGKNLFSGKTIEAKEYVFPERIHDFQIDTINKQLTIQLRGISNNGKWLKNKGHVVRYDTKENEVLWSKKIAFQVANIEQYGGVTIHSEAGKSYCLNNLTGERLWEVKNSLIFANPEKKIGIGYKLSASKGRENILQGINLTNGQSIWERAISREYGWNDVFYINDSTLLIEAAGLHTLNINDGTGWDYSAITGKKDYTASAVGTGLGIVAGLLTGTYAVSSGHDLVRDVVSNSIVDSLNIYQASKDHIVKLSKEGKIIWKTKIPNDLTSKSTIFKSDGNLIMINKGYAYMGYRQLDFGTPFIASFDIKTGKQNFLNTISDNKKEVIKGVDRVDNDLIFLSDERISKYSLANGQKLNERKLSSVAYGGLNNFIGEQVFVPKDSVFISLIKLDTNKHYVYTKTKKVLVLNSDLEILDEVDLKNFYIHYLNRNKMKFIAKEKNTIVINENGQKIAELTASANAVFLNNKLYDAQENSFIEIILDNILNNAP